MFNLFSNKSKLTDLSFLGVDMHSHLIPAIDDGAPTIKDAIFLIEGLQRLGYSKIITTPHVYQEYYPNTTADILNGYALLKSELDKANLDIQLQVAAEYFMDESFREILDQKDVLTIKDDFLLVETSFFGESPDLFQILFEIQTKGYRPILAHPERYTYYGLNPDKYTKLKDRGCLLQLNLGSLVGAYGLEVQKIAKMLLKKDLIDLLGTDLHNELQLQLLQSLLRDRSILRILEKKSFQNHLLLDD